MTLIRDVLRLIKAPAQDRLPQVPASLQLPGIGGLGTGMATGLGQYTASSWIFSIVSRIATAVAASEWQLFKGPEGSERRVESHPLLTLWKTISEFDTRPQFLEASQQHLELTGEAWWILLGPAGGTPTALQLVRPDRMKPIPSRDKHIAGYVYQLGAEQIPLLPEQVIFIRMPSPIDPYRGAGPVQSLLVDIGAEHEAAQWARNFFRNSAEPGGILEFEEELSDEEFNRLVERWRTFHQGVQNSHRVAIVERGKWKDRKFTQRDMQFDQLRRFHIDLFLGAWGIHKATLGMSEGVNRANAEAAAFQFAELIIKPRLVRIREALNHDLAPFFGNDLHFEFVDPTPENRELNLEEAERLYKAQLVTRDEGRARVGLPPAKDGGDEFSAGGGGGMFGAGIEETLYGYPEWWVSRKRAALKAPTLLEQAEARMQQAWAKRFSDEAEGLNAYLDDILDQRRAHATYGLSMKTTWDIRVKIELTDVAGYDWDWWAKYGEALVQELTAGFFAAVTNEWPAIEPNLAQLLASEYAEARGARLLRLDGDLNIVRATRERVNQLVARTIEQGDSLQTLQRALRDDHVFSRERARVVARTETATVQGQGSKGAAAAQGRNEKNWVTQGDDVVSEGCGLNEAAGWIKITDPFPSGHDTIPFHPNCRCNVRYRTAPVPEALAAASSPQVGQLAAPYVSCPTCLKNDTLVPSRDGQGLWCRRCNKAVEGQPKQPQTRIRRTIERDTTTQRISAIVEETITE